MSNVHLQTVTTALLDSVTANDSDGHGINGYQVGSLTLTSVSVERNGNEVGEDGVQLVNSDRHRDGQRREHLPGQRRRISSKPRTAPARPPSTISGAFFGLTNFPTTGAAEAPSPGAGTANSGLLISASGTANMTATVTGSTFDENYANGYLSDTAGQRHDEHHPGHGGQRQRLHQQRRADRDRQCRDRPDDLYDPEQHHHQRHGDHRHLRDHRHHRLRAAAPAR